MNTLGNSSYFLIQLCTLIAMLVVVFLEEKNAK